MIATEIETTVGRDVDRRSIRIPAPIRVLGKYSIPVSFADEVEAKLDVLVEPDEDSQQRIAQAKQAQAEEAQADPTFEEALGQDAAEESETTDDANTSTEDSAEGENSTDSEEKES